MFEDFDDDDIEMIDSITEEEDEDLEESERLPGVTLSEVSQKFLFIYFKS